MDLIQRLVRYMYSEMRIKVPQESLQVVPRFLVVISMILFVTERSSCGILADLVCEIEPVVPFFDSPDRLALRQVSRKFRITFYLDIERLIKIDTQLLWRSMSYSWRVSSGQNSALSPTDNFFLQYCNGIRGIRKFPRPRGLEEEFANYLIEIDFQETVLDKISQMMQREVSDQVGWSYYFSPVFFSQLPRHLCECRFNHESICPQRYVKERLSPTFEKIRRRCINFREIISEIFGKKAVDEIVCQVPCLSRDPCGKLHIQPDFEDMQREYLTNFGLLPACWQGIFDNVLGKASVELFYRYQVVLYSMKYHEEFEKGFLVLVGKIQDFESKKLEIAVSKTSWLLVWPDFSVKVRCNRIAQAR